ncbi:hypothetical protein HY488_03560 [Candidatus Woesearchaeota archaeon]|nr:hypothetical protein [Candidatus Woesearchaeota archaeon]
MRANLDCLRCKGRFCNNGKYCPVLHKITSQRRVNLEAKQDYFGESPNVFVGRFGYPNINVGFLSVEQYKHHDEPLLWSRENYNIDKIIDLRTTLINSSFKAPVTSVRVADGLGNRYLSMGQEIAMARKPVDIEVSLNKKPKFTLSFMQDVTPHGPRVKLKNASLAENPSIPTKVDKVVSDSDLKAGEAILTLYQKGFDEHYLTKLLSVGTLGVKMERKLVPTRWSITAVDDTVGKRLIAQIKQCENKTNYLAFFGGHLGNYYLVLFFPEVWSYELFETYVGGKMPARFGTDYESYEGRKSYAEDTAGGYYAARLAVLEKLAELKRQGSCLCLRFVTDEYWAPLGVWVVREATRKAMQAKPIEFGSKELMMTYARQLVRKKFGYNLEELFRVSKLLHEIGTQKKLGNY